MTDMIEVGIDDERKAAYYRKGYWTTKTLLDAWNEQASTRGSKPYVINGTSAASLTYEAVDAQAAALAAHLQAAGVEEGDVVSFQIPIWQEFAVVFVACLKMGAVAHPVSVSYNTRDLAFVLNQVKSRAFLCPSQTRKGNYEKQAAELHAVVPSIREVVVVEHGCRSMESFPTLEEITGKLASSSAGMATGSAASELASAQVATAASESAAAQAPRRTTSDSVVLILSTSGTTGTPKAVMLTHNNLLFSERTLTEELGIDEHDVMFMPAPLNHATGFNHGLIAPLITGGSVVLQEKFDAQEALAIMDAQQVSWSMGATPFIFDMTRQLEAGTPKPRALKFYLCGGAPLPSSLIQRAAKQGLAVCEVYGSTESCPHAIVPPELASQWGGAFSGKALAGIETKVVDKDRCAVEAGQMGEEASRGPHLFVGYLGDEQATKAAVDEDGWFYSGDLCTQDEQGRIRIMGRRKEIIIRGGKNISAVEIDNLISGCPGIRDYATVGIPDERLGERICLVVVPESENIPSIDDVRSFLQAKNVQKRLWPERVVVANSIPRTESGKVKRNVLTQEIAAWHGEGKDLDHE